MAHFSLNSYIILGVVFWSLGPLFIAPFFVLPSLVSYVVISYTTCRILGGSINNQQKRLEQLKLSEIYLFLYFFFIFIFLYDMLLGRQLFSLNMFVSPGAKEQLIENFAVSQGSSGIFTLVMKACAIVPFIVFDVYKSGSKNLKKFSYFAVIFASIVLFYQVGASRGMLVVSAIAVFFAYRKPKVRYATGAFFIVVMLLLIGNFVRGDQISLLGMVGPIASPIINFSLLMSADCGVGSSFELFLQLLRKLLPILPIEIFQFNLEMTYCLYPGMHSSLGSISIFTWLGEIWYYRPSIFSASCFAIFITPFAQVIERICTKYNLRITKFYIALLCILLTRSRLSDVLTHLVLYLAVLLLFSWAMMIYWKKKEVNS